MLLNALAVLPEDPGFNSQHPHGNLQLYSNRPDALAGLGGDLAHHMVHRHTSRQNTHTPLEIHSVSMQQTTLLGP